MKTIQDKWLKTITRLMAACVSVLGFASCISCGRRPFSAPECMYGGPEMMDKRYGNQADTVADSLFINDSINNDIQKPRNQKPVEPEVRVMYGVPSNFKR